MALTKRGKQPKVADTPIKFKPFRTDLTMIDSLAAASGAGRPDIARMLISEAIKARNLKAVGKDESVEAVVRAQKQAMTEVLAPLLDRVNELGGHMTRFEPALPANLSTPGNREISSCSVPVSSSTNCYSAGSSCAITSTRSI
jgi:hypothetical protein